MTTEPAPFSGGLRNVLLATAILLAVAIALRLGTRVGELAPTWDEPLMQPIVELIVTQGWSVETAIDFEDTKGPVFFWMFAALAEIAGTDVASLRVMNLLVFVLAGVPLGLLASACRLRASETATVAVLFALLPYGAVLGQLFMSEPSFVLGSLLVILSFVWGIAAPAGSFARRVAPVVFGVLVALLLHHRPHIVAGAGAVVLVATARLGVRSWPWWLAAAAAGLARLPLMVRWGGLVSPEYQDRMGIGLRLESLTYLLVSLLPCTILLLWPAIVGERARAHRVWVGVGALLGLALGLLAAPDLQSSTDGHRVYLGMVATTLRGLGPTPLYAIAMTAFATLGGAALAATMLTTIGRRETGVGAAVLSVAGLTVIIGWAMYGLTRGQLFDRYLLPFEMLLPFVWTRSLPVPLRAVQAAGLAIIVARLAVTWLI